MKRLPRPAFFQNLVLTVTAALLLPAPFLPALQAQDHLPATVEFNRDIRPILSDNCFQCHGPDKAQRKADLRLDKEKDVFGDRDGYRVLVPGKLEKSELWKRITAKKRGHMPPRRTGKKLSARQIALIQRWIMQGAKYQKHWSFIPPKRAALPKVKNKNWPRNAIDYFILARLEKEGLQPSPEADRRTLIRRVTLDLTGLPPTLEEIEAFIKDQSPNAFEKVVDRLLNSPHYGERMALPWLDAARYADSNGYQADGERHMWRWRDWVIESFNKNMPFDRFTIDQIAGDLVPNPTLDQLIATGFNRNHRGNAEGGIIPEEFLAEYAVDRVDTTATVWLGLTAGCARCHDHKYDPISQKEFYQLFAYFNNIPERGKVVRFGNSPPLIKAPTRQQQELITKLKRQIEQTTQRCQALEPALQQAQKKWERTALNGPEIEWTLTDGLQKQIDFQEDKSIQSKDGNLRLVDGKIGKAANFDGKCYVDAGNVGKFGFHDKFSLAVWIYPANGKGGVILSRMKDTDRSEGYSLVLDRGAVQLNLVVRWLDDSLRVETKKKLQPGQWYHVLATYDGSCQARGVRVYINGERQQLKINLDDLNQDFLVKEPFKIGSGGGDENRFHGLIDDVRVYDKCLKPADAGLVATLDSISAIVRMPRRKRTPHQEYKLRSYFLQHQAPRRIQKIYHHLAHLQQQWEKLDERIPTVMIMKERKTPRETHVLIRGEYNKKGEQVQRGVPASFPSLPEGMPNNRLALAKWLVSADNPLTARVAVNRYWQMLFGTGLVKTTEDFGSQGEWPSHPELLDWLAVEFRESGWNIKHMLRLIVTSAAYRQSSRVTAERLQKDPDNRLLSRGPRVRLSAHAIRDQALFISGLLVHKLGGPSVKPYQPKGLWEELSGTKYIRDKGEKLYRRSLYIFWKRTIPAPGMMTFDAAGRESCIVRQTRTNTPLQALNLMNDVAFVEASRMLAQRMMIHGGKTPAARIAFAFELATSRKPRPAEMKILLLGFKSHLQRYRNDSKAALKLVNVGDAPRNRRLDVSELAAYTALASVILNLDETITKQ